MTASADKRLRIVQRELAAALDEVTAALEGERGRRRGPLNQRVWLLRKMLRQVPAHYFSEFGQDRYVDDLLGGREGGVFVDVGGYDGITSSNTLFFELIRGWTGLLIEPAQVPFSKAARLRRCPCLDLAVAGSAQTRDFVEIVEGRTQMSGFLDTYDVDMLTLARQDARHREIGRAVQSDALAEILRAHGITRVDYISLDVEGAELEILRSFAFDDLPVRVWSVENRAGDVEIPKLMRAQGYELAEFLGVDEIYFRKA